MAAYSLHTLAKRLSDWKIIIAVGIVVVTTIFNSITALFNYALITKLAPINAKVSAIEQSGKERDIAFDDFKSNYDRQYGGLIDRVDTVSNKIDKLTIKLIGVTLK